jgi:acetate kinase
MASSNHILTLNAGSSSLKFALFESLTLACATIGQIDGLGVSASMTAKDGAGVPFTNLPVWKKGTSPDYPGALAIILAFITDRFPSARISAVGHRVVHGGSGYDRSVIIDSNVIKTLTALTSLAPLHQPHNLAGIAAATSSFPDVPQIACFDTAFHRGHPFVQDTFAIPRSLYDEGVRRYGFHGLSYEYVISKLREIAPNLAKGKVIVCHLGNGASVCAMDNGHSITSTQGFSPLDGLPMGTRPGQLDPAVVLYLMQEKGMTAEAISDLLFRQSGLKGLSGISSDMRDLLASDHTHAQEAIEYLISRIRREIGGLAAVLEGVDALVFCGGIGENAVAIREGVLKGLSWMGIDFDPTRNRAGNETISPDTAAIGVFIIRTNEELMIARHTAHLVGS